MAPPRERVCAIRQGPALVGITPRYVPRGATPCPRSASDYTDPGPPVYAAPQRSGMGFSPPQRLGQGTAVFPTDGIDVAGQGDAKPHPGAQIQSPTLCHLAPRLASVWRAPAVHRFSTSHILAWLPNV